jgi:Undecaprenyl-phosphate glucose phosphotransferase
MLKKQEKLFFLTLLVISDIIIINGCFLLAYYVRFVLEIIPVTKGVPPLGAYIKILPLVTVIWLWVFRQFDLYNTRRNIPVLDQSFIIFKAVSMGTLAIMAVTFFYREFSYSRLVIVCNWIISLFIFIESRLLLKRLHLWMFRRGIEVKRTLIIGFNDIAKKLIDKIKKHNLDYAIIGIIDDNPALQDQIMDGVRILGPLSSTGLYAKGKDVDEIIFTISSNLNDKIREVIRQCEGLDINYSVVPDFYEIIRSKANVSEIDNMPLIGLNEIPLKGYNRVLKRIMDVLFSFILLLLLTPLFVVLSVIIKLDSPGPIFFRQKRVGMDRKAFTLYKFRSMRHGTKEDESRIWTTEDDPRRTKFGVFLRRWSIDELPQFWNVFCGDMSLVGPRPERPHFVREFKSRIPSYMERHKVKSGITGWAQVNGLRGDTSIEERTKYDLYYIENWSLWFDIKILLMTLFSFTKGAY